MERKTTLCLCYSNERLQSDSAASTISNDLRELIARRSKTVHHSQDAFAGEICRLYQFFAAKKTLHTFLHLCRNLQSHVSCLLTPYAFILQRSNRTSCLIAEEKLVARLLLRDTLAAGKSAQLTISVWMDRLTCHREGAHFGEEDAHKKKTRTYLSDAALKNAGPIQISSICLLELFDWPANCLAANRSPSRTIEAALFTQLQVQGMRACVT